MTIKASLTSFVPQIVQWQLQSEHNVYDTLGKDWELHEFRCIMKDGSKARLLGINDEGGVSFWFTDEDKDYDLEDIVYWLEIPYPPSIDLLDTFKKEEIQKEILKYKKDFFEEIKTGKRED